MIEIEPGIFILGAFIIGIVVASCVICAIGWYRATTRRGYKRR